MSTNPGGPIQPVQPINPGGPISPVKPSQPPSLSDWASEHLSALYNAQTSDDFNLAFTAFFSNSLVATLNGQSISRSDYQNALWQEFNNEISVNFQIQNEIVSPGDGSFTGTPSTTTGTVGLTYSAQFLAKGTGIIKESEHTVHSTLIIQVAEDDVPIGPVPPGTIIDLRRVVSLQQVIYDQPGVVAL